MSTSYGVYQSNPELLDVVDHLSRVAGFLAQEFQGYLEGGAETIDPKLYIDGKLELATLHMKRYYDKTKEF
jgi:hypothetical protein